MDKNNQNQYQNNNNQNQNNNNQNQNKNQNKNSQNMVIKCRNQFEDLPLEIRKKFDNDADLYVSMYGTNEWAEALGYNKPMEVQKAVENVQKGEMEINE